MTVAEMPVAKMTVSKVTVAGLNKKSPRRGSKFNDGKRQQAQGGISCENISTRPGFHRFSSFHSRQTASGNLSLVVFTNPKLVFHFFTSPFSLFHRPFLSFHRLFTAPAGHFHRPPHARSGTAAGLKSGRVGATPLPPRFARGRTGENRWVNAHKKCERIGHKGSLHSLFGPFFVRTLAFDPSSANQITVRTLFIAAYAVGETLISPEATAMAMASERERALSRPRALVM